MNCEKCCEQYAEAGRLSRRRFLGGMAAATTTAVTTTFFGDALRQTASGAMANREESSNVLVVLSLRGGVDGLGIVVPHGDTTYYAARPTVAVPKSALIACDGLFGLHPGMAPLKWLWNQGELAAVHAVGLPVPNRSHFSAMELIEEADPSSSLRRGWVNRMIGLDTNIDQAEAVHLSSSIVPTMLAGPAPVLAASALKEIAIVGADTSYWAGRRQAQLSRIWSGAQPPALHAGFQMATRSADHFAPVASAAYTPAMDVYYPEAFPAKDLSDALKDTAQLIKADLGVDVISIDYGSWDMHADYGTPTAGKMQSMTAGLAGALDAFMRDLGRDVRQRVTLVTISEFGRRIKENGSRGLDHGWGNVMLVAGAGVKGGRYYGTWPGLGSAPDDDLQVTTDYRNVLGEILTRRFPGRTLSRVFPGFSYSPVGFMR